MKMHQIYDNDLSELERECAALAGGERMTGRPETLEAALAWLNVNECAMEFRGISVALWCSNPWGEDTVHVTQGIRNGDIPAAIVEAVGQVWEQVNGEGSE